MYGRYDIPFSLRRKDLILSLGPNNGMLAYSKLQKREFEMEHEHGYRAVKHQSFVGAGYFDDVTQVITGGRTATAAMRGSTEEQQFTEQTPDFVETESHHMSADELQRKSSSSKRGER